MGAVLTGMVAGLVVLYGYLAPVTLPVAGFADLQAPANGEETGTEGDTQYSGFGKPTEAQASSGEVLTHTFSFENMAFDEWMPDGTDLDLAYGMIRWLISHDTLTATHGTTAMRFYLENHNDAGKIWLERPFHVEPDTEYEVRLTFDLGSEAEEVGAFSIIAGAFSASPETLDDLKKAYRGTIYNGVPYWTEQTYTSTVRASANGTIYVAFGIWGTFEVTHIYHFDNVKVQITPQHDTSHQLYMPGAWKSR